MTELEFDFPQYAQKVTKTDVVRNSLNEASSWAEVLGPQFSIFADKTNKTILDKAGQETVVTVSMICSSDIELEEDDVLVIEDFGRCKIVSIEKSGADIVQRVMLQ